MLDLRIIPNPHSEPPKPIDPPHVVEFFLSLQKGTLYLNVRVPNGHVKVLEITPEGVLRRWPYMGTDTGLQIDNEDRIIEKDF